MYIKDKTKYLEILSELYNDNPEVLYHGHKEEDEVYRVTKDSNYTLLNIGCNTNSRQQLEKLEALNKLMNLSRAFNKGQKREAYVYFIKLDENNEPEVRVSDSSYYGIYFADAVHASVAIDILGYKCLRTALSETY